MASLEGTFVIRAGKFISNSGLSALRIGSADLLYVETCFLVSLEDTFVIRAGKFISKSGLSALKIGSVVLL